MPSSPVTSDIGLVTFTISVDGSAVESGMEIFSIEISKGVCKIPSARFIIADAGPEEGSFPLSNKPTFKPGAVVEIKAGYHSTEKTVFKGLIIKHGVRVYKKKAAISIECKGKALKMTLGRKNAFYEKKTDADILKALIGNAGLSATVGALSIKHPFFIQHQISDWDLLIMRAEANGFIVVADADKVSVEAPKTSVGAICKVEFGSTILDMHIELDARTQIKKAKAFSWDTATQKNLSGDSSSTSPTTPGNITSSTLAAVLGLSQFELRTSAGLTQSELSNWASGKLMKAELSKVKGRVKFPGNADVNPGTMIELAGLGDRINGKCLVGAVTQRIEDGTWVTEAHLGLDFEWFAEETPLVQPADAAALMPALKGLHSGIVANIHEDADSTYKIKVMLPLLGDTAYVWARFANFYASNNAGIGFFPEIDDEVIVGFLNEDPRYAVILGSIYGSKHTPPIPPEDKNPIKGISTVEKLKLLFKDADKIIEISTPEGNIITMDDAKGITIVDKNKNKIEMNASGIVIESAKDIEIKAPKGDIKMSCLNMEIDAKTAFKAKSVKIEAEAQAQVKIAGNAQAEFSSGGQTVIKGSLVQIN